MKKVDKTKKDTKSKVKKIIFHMFRRNKEETTLKPKEEIAGFLALYKLKGVEAARKFITGEKNKLIDLDIERPLHTYLLAIMLRKYQVTDFQLKTLPEHVVKSVKEFGLIIKNNNKIRDFTKKMAIRILSDSGCEDKLTSHKLMRQISRISCLGQKAVKFAISQQPSILRFSYLKTRGNGVFDCFLKSNTGLVSKVVRVNLRKATWEVKTPLDVYNEFKTNNL